MAPRFAVRRLADVPRVATEPDELHWYPLQHYFGLTAFGANVYVAQAAGEALLGDHDESGSNQEELYIVTSGEAAFVIDGEPYEAPAMSVVAVPDPAVRRFATATMPGTTIVAIGGERQSEFRTSWQRRHFENVPKL